MKNLLLCLLVLGLTANFGWAVAIADIPDISPKFDDAPVPLKTPPPKYPAQLRADQISGVVSIVVVIDEKGAVMAAEVSKSSNPGFNDAALDAVRGWKFKPAKLGGKEVKVRVKLPLQFNVQD
jgi:protein TonB